MFSLRLDCRYSQFTRVLTSTTIATTTITTTATITTNATTATSSKKIDKYQSLKIKLEQLWKVTIMVIPVVVGALGAIADRLPGWLAQIPGTISEVELLSS